MNFKFQRMATGVLIILLMTSIVSNVLEEDWNQVLAWGSCLMAWGYIFFLEGKIKQLQDLLDKILAEVIIAEKKANDV